jgi:opacity protein-like surface antigen
MTKYIFFAFFLMVSLSTSAQLYQEAFHITWNTLKPLSDKEFTNKTSSSGVRIGFSKFINDRFGFGLEGSYNTLDDYSPLQVYDLPNGAISTDVYNYLYYFTVLANAQYYFKQGDKFIPYASLGMGAAFSEYRIFYNVYEDADSQIGFVLRPEVGTLFRFKEYSRWGLKSSLSYEYATNKSDYFEVENFSGVSLQIGVVMFTD